MNESFTPVRKVTLISIRMYLVSAFFTSDWKNVFVEEKYLDLCHESVLTLLVFRFCFSEINEIEESPEIEENTQLGPWMKKRYTCLNILCHVVISVSVVFVHSLSVAKTS